MQENAVGFWLSPQQRLAWKLRQEVGKDCPWPACLVQLCGQVDSDRLRECLENIVRRHEVLRTRFARKPGLKIPFQMLLEGPAVDWETVDYSGSSRQERDSLIASLWNRAIAPAPPSEVQPPLEAILAQIEKDHWFLVLRVHPLCADGPSLGIIVREMIELYAGKVNRLPEPFRYLQFAQWQTDLLEADDRESQKGRDFWKRQLQATTPHLPYIPSDDACGFRPQLLRQPISTPASSALFERKDVVEFLFAAWQLLVHRLSGQNVFQLGFVADNREYEELQNAVGCFSRTLPVATRIEKDSSFADLVQQTRAWVGEASPLAECFSPEAIGSEGNLISFSYLDLGEGHTQNGLTITLERLQVVHESSQLRLVAVRQGEKLVCEFHYDAARLEQAIVERMAVYYQNLLEAALCDPSARLTQLRLLPDREWQKLVNDWNQTEAVYPEHLCLHELFEQQAERVPDRVALRCGQRTYTYRELNESANQLAHYLREQGVAADRLVGLCVERGTDMILCLLAILKAGGAYVPLNPDNPSARMQQQLDGLTALITQSAFSMPDFPGVRIVVDRDQRSWEKHPKSNPAANPNPENLAYVIYTSGSTGAPKGVAVRHRNLVNYAHFITQRLELEKSPQGLAFGTVSTLSADLGNTCIFPALISGGCLHVLDYENSTDPRRFAGYVAEYPLDVLKIVPSHLQSLLDSDAAASLLPRKHLILGGEKPSARLIERILSFEPRCEILNHYGPTETTVGSLTFNLKDFNGNPAQAGTIPIGRPIANTQAYILDQNLQPVPQGAIGELYIGGAGVAAGYWGQPEKTAERFLPDPFALDAGRKIYRTGDRARHLDDGNIEFLGRTDDQVKIRGFRVELGEIEAALRTHQAVKQAVVIAAGINSEVRLLGYVVMNHLQVSADNTNGEQLRAYLKQHLPDYMVPEAIEILAKLPLTSNGKIDRQALPDPHQRNQVRVYVSPATDTERTLASIWAEVLRRDPGKIGREDNFFELGGHSLLATQVISRIRERFPVEIPMRLIFESPTISALAEVIGQAQEMAGRKEEIGIEPVAREAYRI